MRDREWQGRRGVTDNPSRENSMSIGRQKAVKYRDKE